MNSDHIHNWLHDKPASAAYGRASKHCARAARLPYLKSTQDHGQPRSASRSRFPTSARSTPGCCGASPLTLVDTGPRDDEALAALEAGLARAGVRVEDIELVLRHASPPRPHRPGRDDRRPLRRAGSPRSTARPPTAGTTTSGPPRTAASRSRSCATTACPNAVIADNEGFWDFIRARVGRLPRRRRAARRRDHPRRRPRPARRRAARAQHHGRPARRRARAHRLRRRPPARRDLVQHRDLPGPGARRDAPAGAGRVPPEPAARRPPCRSPGC